MLVKHFKHGDDHKGGYGLFYCIFDNKNIWIGESYDNCFDFMAAILNFSFQNNPLRMTAPHRPRY